MEMYVYVYTFWKVAHTSLSELTEVIIEPPSLKNLIFLIQTANSLILLFSLLHFRYLLYGFQNEQPFKGLINCPSLQERFLCEGGFIIIYTNVYMI